jgi:P4 family phage/plasmid primase-like protien
VIQILGLRPYFNEKKQQWDITDGTFFKKNWRAPSVVDLFQNIDHYTSKIPTKERYNLFYTVANCAEGKRQFQEQHVMVFDVDGLDHGQDRERYITAVCSALGLDRKATGIVFSGNGLHFIVGLQTPIVDPSFFDLNKRHYMALVSKVDLALSRGGLPGKADPAVFDARRIMRLPGTINKKEGKPERSCALLNGNIQAVPFDITQLSGLPTVEAADHINPQTLRRYPRPDTTAVLSSCDFLKFCKDEPNAVSEEQWYASLSILPRLENGHELAHEYSRGYSRYSQPETDAKIEQALAASGPRTCQNINKTWGKCSGCPHFEKVSSPIMIRGANYIQTQETGFHETVIDAKGNPKPGKPCYEDLRRYFEQQQPYVVLGESKICLVWTGKFWREMKDAYLEAFAQDHFKPTAKTDMTSEFKNLVCRTNLRETAWFTSTTSRKINFNNGVLDLDTMQLGPHSPDYGFRYALAYDYDPTAEAPRFDKFLREVMNHREDLCDVVLEYAGYSFSNDVCWAQKALIMTGEGANGKSTLMSVFRALAGKENYASLTLGDLKAETNRQQLDGRLFNLAEETPTYAMAESSLFKNLVSGGETTVKMLYKQPYTIANKCKLMFACNELPKTKDTTKGFFRRLLIVPFDRTFEGSDRDSFLEEKLMQELPGIFNLVIRGYRRLKDKRAFTESSAIDKEIHQYRLELDTVASWFRDCVEDEKTETGVATQLSKLYSGYKFFTENRGDKPEIYTVFCKRMMKLVHNYNARIHRKLIDGKKETVIFGIKYGEASHY